MELDRTDVLLLEELQKDGQANNKELARIAGLSPSATLERVRRLFREGYIQRVAAVLDPRRVDLALLAFILVDLDRLQLKDEIVEALRELRHVVEIHTVTGEPFFLLKTRTSGTEQLNEVVSRIAELPGVRTTKTLIGLETFKETTDLPLSSGAP